MGQNPLHSPAAPFVTGNLLLINRTSLTIVFCQWITLKYLTQKVFFLVFGGPNPCTDK